MPVRIHRGARRWRLWAAAVSIGLMAAGSTTAEPVSVKSDKLALTLETVATALEHP